jgi:hypothetical protein
LDGAEEGEGFVNRLVVLATAAMLAMLVLVPAAMAKDKTMMEETTMMGGTMMEETTMMGGGQKKMMDETTMMGGGQKKMMEETTMMMNEDLPESGGPAILLPAAALLLGSGVLAFAVLRRR